MNPIKPTLKTEIFPIFVLILLIVSSFYFFLKFPPRVPTHWNMTGAPDGWSSRTIAAFLFPGIIVATYLLLFLLPYIDPQKDKYGQFSRVYHIIKTLIVGFMAAIYFVVSLNSSGHSLPIGFFIPGLVGMLFIFLGYYMGEVKPNWFIGIRTPWTLSSEKVWQKTHRLSGKIFIVGGFIIAVSGLLPPAWRAFILFIDIIFIIFGTTGSSYVLYRREEKRNRKASL